jgi:DNA-binding LacI/PurR family transcriptional regulator
MVSTSNREDPAVNADAMSKREARPVTSADVARLSGLSRATVSYVLNEKEGRTISAQARDRVLRAAEQLGYEPNAAARALRSGRSEIVVTLIPGLAVGYVFSEELRTVGHTLAKAGFTLLILDQSLIGSSRRTWRTVKPAAVVAVGPVSDDDRAAFERLRVPLIDVSTLVSNEEIGRLQARHLIARGHRRLAFAHAVESDLLSFSAARAAGVREELASASLPPLQEAGVVLRAGGADEAVDRWLADPETQPTAICAHNDEIALLTLAALENRGLRVGDDISIIGADDIPLAGANSLTTVAIDSDLLARTLSSRILTALQHDDLSTPVPAPALHLIRRRSG